MKITFIETKPYFPGWTFGWMKKTPLLGQVYLGTILKERGHEVEIIKESITIFYRIKALNFHEKYVLKIKDFYVKLKNFTTYQIIARLKVIPSRIFGLIGQLIKKINPRLYYLFKGKNGTKKKS